jgi:hypothetical protein
MSTDSSRAGFDVWLGRAVRVAALGIMAAIAYVVITSMAPSRDAAPDPVATAALGGNATTKSTATLGAFAATVGTPVMRAALTEQEASRGSGPDFSSGYGPRATIRNYLFFDPATRTSHWLRPSMAGWITQTVEVSADERSNLSEVRVVVYVIQDSTKAQTAPSEQLPSSIAISNPTGKQFRVLVAKADRLNATRLLSRERLLLIYAIGGKLMALELDLSTANAVAEEYEVSAAMK